MTSPWAENAIETFTIPSDAGPGETRIVLTTVLPPPLDTYTFLDGVDVYRYVAAIIYYRGDGDDTSYNYDAVAQAVALPGYPLHRHLGEVRAGAVVERSAQHPMVLEFRDPIAGLNTEKNISADFVQLFQRFVNCFLAVRPTGIALQSDSTGANLQSINLLAKGAAGVSSLLDLNPNGAGNGATLQSTAAGKDVLIQSAVDVNITASDDINLLTLAGGDDINLGAADAVNVNATGDFNINAVNMDVVASPRVGAGNRTAYLEYEPSMDICNATTAIAGTTAGTATAISGLSRNVTVETANDHVSVRAYFDVVAAVAPTSTFDGILQVDGVTQTAHATYRTGTAGLRATVSQEWEITGLSAGVHTFTLLGFNGVANNYSVAANNSTMKIEPKYHK